MSCSLYKLICLWEFSVKIGLLWVPYPSLCPWEKCIICENNLHKVIREGQFLKQSTVGLNLRGIMFTVDLDPYMYWRLLLKTSRLRAGAAHGVSWTGAGPWEFLCQLPPPQPWLLMAPWGLVHPTGEPKPNQPKDPLSLTRSQRVDQSPSHQK